MHLRTAAAERMREGRQIELVDDAGYAGIVHQLEARVYAKASDDRNVVRLPAVARFQRPGRTTASVAGRQVRDERRTAKCDLVAVMQSLIDRMLLASRLHCLKRRNIFRHGHHLRASQLLDHGIAFLVIAVRVAPQEDLRIGELESQLLHGLLDCRHIPLVCAVDEEIPLRRDDEEGS